MELRMRVHDLIWHTWFDGAVKVEERALALTLERG
jgi:hypothetical protein